MAACGCEVGVVTPQHDEVNGESGIGFDRETLLQASDSSCLDPAQDVSDPLVAVIDQATRIVPTHFVVTHEWLLPLELEENDAAAAGIVRDEINVGDRLTIPFQLDTIKAVPVGRWELCMQFGNPSAFSSIGSIKPILLIPLAQLCPEK